MTGSFATIVLYINELFPTPMRSTGAGLSKSIGRVGMMLAPSIGYVVSYMLMGFEREVKLLLLLHVIYIAHNYKISRRCSWF